MHSFYLTVIITTTLKRNKFYFINWTNKRLMLHEGVSGKDGMCTKLISVFCVQFCFLFS